MAPSVTLASAHLPTSANTDRMQCYGSGMFLPGSRIRSVADPHHFNSDRDPAFHFHAYPDHPTFHFYADPDPAPQRSNANLWPLVSRPWAPFVPLSVHGPPWLHFKPLKPLNFDFNANPDSNQAFHSNADLDPLSQNTLNAIRIRRKHYRNWIFFIPEQQKKRREKSISCLPFLRGHKFHKIVNYLILNRNPTKKDLRQFT